MGHFDGMKNQRQLEISYKKLVSAFIDLAEDLVKREQNHDGKKAACADKANHLSKSLKPKQGGI